MKLVMAWRDETPSVEATSRQCGDPDLTVCREGHSTGGRIEVTTHGERYRAIADEELS